MTETQRPGPEDFVWAKEYAERQVNGESSFRTTARHLSWCYLALAAENKALEDRVRAPIPMIIHCPECMSRHFDEGEFATKPHHTHSCQTCGLTWRPAIVPTVGVKFLPGFKNAADDAKAAGEPERNATLPVFVCVACGLESPKRGHAAECPGKSTVEPDDRASRRLAYVREKAPVILAGTVAADDSRGGWELLRKEAIEQAGLIFDETEQP